MGFSISSGLFSWTGLLAEISFSVSRTPCAGAVIRANAAVTTAVELPPRNSFLKDLPRTCFRSDRSPISRLMRV